MSAWRAALAALLLAGCASTSPKEAFRDTAALVEARTGRRIEWNAYEGGSGEDTAVARKVHELLARPLTVDAAVQLALLENPGLKATYEDLSLAQADLVQAGLLQNPVFGGGVQFPVEGAVRRGFDLSVSQDFMSVFLLAARKKVAAAELRATELRVGDAVLHAAYEVESAYYALAAAQQTAAMRKSVLAAGDVGLDLARRQQEAGNLSELDLASQEVMVEQARADLLRSEADVVTAHEALTRLLGLWGPEVGYRVVDSLPSLPSEEVPLEHLEALAVGRRLDLAAAGEEAQALAHALAMAKNYRFLGGAQVGAAYEHAPESYTVLGPSAAIEVPIFDQKQAAIARLEGRLRKALAHVQELAIGARSEVREARSRLLACRAVVERYASVIVPLRERVLILAQQQHDAMLLGTYALLQAKQGEVTAYGELILALRDYWTARADLARATGGSVTRPTGPNSPSPGATTRVAPGGAP